MQRKLLSILAGGALLFSATASAFAQDQSGGATSGGATSGGAASEAPAPAEQPAPPAQSDNRNEAGALPPEGAAGPTAPFFSDTALIGIGAAAVLAGILVAVTSSSSSTTTTTVH
jgi:hypothetical protein